MSREMREPPLIEPFLVSAVYCDGVGCVEVGRHGNAHVVLSVDQRSSDGQIERIVAARLTLPATVLQDLIAAGMQALSDHGGEQPTAVSLLHQVEGHA